MINTVEAWKHLIGQTNNKGVILTEAMLKNWEDTSGMFECVFCGQRGSFLIGEGDFICCRRCNSFKGIQPYIEG